MREGDLERELDKGRPGRESGYLTSNFSLNRQKRTKTMSGEKKANHHDWHFTHGEICTFVSRPSIKKRGSEKELLRHY